MKRSTLLDEYLNKLVDVKFTDGTELTGVLEYGACISGRYYAGKYTLYVFGSGTYILKRTYVRKIREHK